MVTWAARSFDKSEQLGTRLSLLGYAAYQASVKPFASPIMMTAKIITSPIRC